jgi:hypothetical protein
MTTMSLSGTPAKTDYLVSAKGNSIFDLNQCDLCQLKLGALSHTPGKCCIGCRNYDLIDAVARRYSLAWVRGQLETEIWPVETANPPPPRPKITVDEILKKGLQYQADSLPVTKRLTETKAEYTAAVQKRDELAKARKDAARERDTAYSLIDKTLNSLVDPTGDQQSLNQQLQSETAEFDKLVKKVADIQRDLDVSKAEVEALNGRVNELDIEAGQAKSKEDSERQDIVRGIAKRLVQYLIDDVSSVMNPAGGDARFQLDPIDRARFFFTWIADSIVYDKTVKEPDRSQIRDTLNTLHFGKEVCDGLSELFEVMFNGTSTTSLKPSSITQPDPDSFPNREV